MKKVKVVKERGLAVVGNKQMSVDTLISQAIDKNVPVETMEKLLVMRRELKAEYAKEEFNKAMSEFQAKCPTIKKIHDGGKTKLGKVAYKYAPIDSIVEQTKELIKEYGFSYSFQTVMTEKTVKAILTINHIAGHSKQNDVEFPLTTRTEIMSAPQVVAATRTFAERYAFQDGFGIITGDEDIDGQVDDEKSKTTKPSAVNIPDAEIVPQKTTKPEPTKRIPGKSAAVNQLLDETPSKIKTDAEKIEGWITAIKKEAKGQKLSVGKFDEILRACGVPESYDYENFDKLNDIGVLESIFEGVVKFDIKRK